MAAVHAESSKLAPIHESWKTGRSVAWKRIHNLPQFVFFNHAVHVNSGVSCKTCHGRIDQMEVVEQAKELSMAWCIECHRNPEPHLRPVEYVTKLDWEPTNENGEPMTEEERFVYGEKLKGEKHINPQVNCAVCRR